MFTQYKLFDLFSSTGKSYFAIALLCLWVHSQKIRFNSIDFRMNIEEVVLIQYNILRTHYLLIKTHDDYIKLERV